MPADTPAVQPLTFNDMPWVKEIDTLPDVDWLQSNPDGKQRLAMIHALDVKPEAVELITRPLRNLVKLMLEDVRDSEGNNDVCGMLSLLETVKDAPVWLEMEDHENYEIVLKEDLERLRKDFSAAPLTFKCFLEHLRADAEHYIALALKENEKGSVQPDA